MRDLGVGSEPEGLLLMGKKQMVSMLKTGEDAVQLNIFSLARVSQRRLVCPTISLSSTLH